MLLHKLVLASPHPPLHAFSFVLQIYTITIVGHCGHKNDVFIPAILEDAFLSNPFNFSPYFLDYKVQHILGRTYNIYNNL